MPMCLFNKFADLLAWNFKLMTQLWIFFNEFCKNFKNTFLQDTSIQLLLIFRKLHIQTFNSKQICSLDQYRRHFTVELSSSGATSSIFHPHASKKILQFFRSKFYLWPHICRIFHPRTAKCWDNLWNYVRIKYNQRWT